MAGGVAPSSASDSKGTSSQSAANQTDTAYAPTQTTTPTYVPPTAAASFNPYIALSQQGYGNPYAIMGGGSASGTTATTRPTSANASNLAALSAAYQTTADTAIAKQKADMIAQSNAAQLEYQRTLAAKKAAEDSKYNAMVAKLNQGYVWQNGQLVKPEYEFGSLGWFANQSGYTGAQGGLASLEGFDR